MRKFRNLFLKNKQEIYNKNNSEYLTDHYGVIGDLIKEARLQRNISIKELSLLSKIPEYIIYSIENNIKNSRPEYPFIRSILIKLEECLYIKKDTLISFLVKESRTYKKDQKKFTFRKFDFFNTWEGTFLYFLLLISIIFVLKRYFFSDVSIIEIQNIEEKINKN